MIGAAESGEDLVGRSFVGAGCFETKPAIYVLRGLGIYLTIVISISFVCALAFALWFGADSP